MTRKQYLEAAILLRESELHDLDMLLGDGCSHAGIQRLANRDPLGWTMRLIEVGRLVHLARCLPLLAVVAGILPEELDSDLRQGNPRPPGGLDTSVYSSSNV